ncbi:lamin tail domain-containing protein [Actinosynnema sp. NPDC020468]|uniref:lamin tail domain-containing protein n=1 Tax=Actinosynnema sp. NPDC020468 TaxID=3154488 RepID=UPI0033E6E564
MASLALVTLLAASALVADPGQWPVKVQSVLTAGSTGYVELRNISSTSVDLSGWTVRGCAGATTVDLAELPAGAVLPGSERFLVAGADFAGPAARITVPALVGDGLVLVDRRRARVDAVATTPSSPCSERRAAAPCGALPLSRDPDGADTDDNSQDFHCAPPFGP